LYQLVLLCVKAKEVLVLLRLVVMHAARAQVLPSNTGSA
jgi:hypothetical protein